MVCLSIDITGAINDVHFLSVVPKQENFRVFPFHFCFAVKIHSHPQQISLFEQAYFAGLCIIKVGF